MPWTTIEGLKTRLGIAAEDTSEDTVLTLMLTAAESCFLGKLNRPYFTDPGTDQTLYLNGSGRPALVLPESSLVSVTAVYEDRYGYAGYGPDSFGAASALVRGVDYYPRELGASEANPGILERIQWNWPEVRGSVKFVGRLGYIAGSIPEICEAIYKLAVLLDNERETGNQVSKESLGKYSYEYSAQMMNYGTGPEIGSVRSVLNTFREIPE